MRPVRPSWTPGENLPADDGHSGRMVQMNHSAHRAARGDGLVNAISGENRPLRGPDRDRNSSRSRRQDRSRRQGGPAAPRQPEARIPWLAAASSTRRYCPTPNSVRRPRRNARLGPDPFLIRLPVFFDFIDVPRSIECIERHASPFSIGSLPAVQWDRPIHPSSA